MVIGEKFCAPKTLKVLDLEFRPKRLAMYDTNKMALRQDKMMTLRVLSRLSRLPIRHWWKEANL